MDTTLELAGNATSNDPDVGLRAVAALRRLTEQMEILQVDNARAQGWSWREIADRLGVTKQTVHRKHGRADRETVMLERFTGDARGVVTGARECALRLGHDWIGCEHLLLALATTGGEVGVMLRGQVITAERITWEAVRLAGAGRGASLSDVLDRDALASIGIDLDAVRDKVEAAFGPGAFTAAPGRGPQRRHWARRRVRRARQARWAAAPAGGGTHTAGLPGAPASGKGSGAGPWRVAFTPRARKCLAHAVHEARAEHTGQIGVEHLGLAIVSMTDGAVPRLRAEILHRYRQAS